MYWLITHIDSDKRWKVKAASEGEAVRRWYRADTKPGFLSPEPLSNAQIQNIYESGDFNIEVIPESAYVELC